MRIGNSPARRNARRIRTLERKAAQLESGMKPTNEGNWPMSEEETAKLAKEVSVLNSRIVSKELAASTKHKKYRGA